MPQADNETLITAGAAAVDDRKIADDDEVPPESFWLSKDAEYDWFDRNAFYDRSESTRGNSNSNQHVNPNTNSQRFSVSLKNKASVIRLPKTQKTAFVESKRRVCTKPANMRLFPNRSGSSAGKPAAAMAEPSSPKVSCMGRVRSKRGRRRSNSVKKNEKPPEKSEKTKTGFRSKVMSLFRSKNGRKNPTRSGSRRVVEILMKEPVDLEKHRRSVSVKVREIPAMAAADPPRLGGVMKLSSGRRSESLTAGE